MDWPQPSYGIPHSCAYYRNGEPVRGPVISIMFPAYAAFYDVEESAFRAGLARAQARWASTYVPGCLVLVSKPGQFVGVRVKQNVAWDCLDHAKAQAENWLATERGMLAADLRCAKPQNKRERIRSYA